MIAQTEVLIEARNKAWKRRFEDVSKKPLYFPLLIGLYDEKTDYAREKATKKVDVSPLFNMARTPAAGHSILAGSWDHQAMSFKDPPDLKLMAVAAGIGLFGTGLDVAASLDDPLGLLQEAGNFLSSGKNTRDADSKQYLEYRQRGINTWRRRNLAGGPTPPILTQARANRSESEKRQRKVGEAARRIGRPRRIPPHRRTARRGR